MNGTAKPFTPPAEFLALTEWPCYVHPGDVPRPHKKREGTASVAGYKHWRTSRAIAAGRKAITALMEDPRGDLSIAEWRVLSREKQRLYDAEFVRAMDLDRVEEKMDFWRRAFAEDVK